MVDRGNINYPEVLRLLAEGNESAFSEIYDRYWPATFKVAIQYLNDDAAAHDVVHDVFLNLWRNRKKFQGVIELKYYLMKCVKNRTYKEIQRLARERRTEQVFIEEHLENHSRPDQALEGQQLEEILKQAVESLTPDQKRIFTMHREQGLSHKDIAQHLNLSVRTTESHFSNALRSIKRYLHRHSGSAAIISILIRIFPF